MRDLLPDGLFNLIRDRYLAGVSDAQEKYEMSKGDEDALTGALGQAISTPHPTIYSSPAGKYQWHISYQKIRGRGPAAPEKLLGADGIFEIEVFDENGKPLRQKGLPFQSMKNWSKPIGEMRRQAGDMIRATGEGVLVNFEPGKYVACSAFAATEDGRSKRVLRDSGQFKDLGHVLGDDFLECEIGRVGLYYDPDSEIYRDHNRQPLSISHAVRTSVNKIR